MYDRILRTTRDSIGTNMKNQAVKEHVDLLFIDVNNNINHKIERDYLCMFNQNGFFNLPKANTSQSCKIISPVSYYILLKMDPFIFLN